jgi:two-component system, OmpR family, sensor kinase
LRQFSLLSRLVFCLSVAQIFAFVIAWLVTVGVGLMGVEVFATSLDEVATIRAKKQVVKSLVANAVGEIEIRPTPDLRDELTRAPNMKFAAFKSTNLQPIAGSSPQLVSVLRPLIEISPTHVHFVLPGDPSAIRAGLMEPQWTPFGRVHIAVYGQKFRWTDIFHAAQEDMRWLLLYLSMVILMSTGAAWIAVRWGLIPLRNVANQAMQIDMDSLHQRIIVDGMSQEIVPLVDAINGALARLDAGVGRHRRFLANAAHELRTPVMVLGARLDAPEEPTFKTGIRNDYRRIRNIVEQLLSSIRLGEKSGKSDEPIDLCSTARSVIADAALLAVRTHRQIVLEAPSFPVMIKGNRHAIESVIVNLVDNAVRAEPEGGTIIVRVDKTGLLEVVDHGDGVEEKDREQIFEPFWRKNHSGAGTGLGLAIAKELIEALEGRIWVEDTPNGGATFKISFLVVRATHDASAYVVR